VSDIGSPGSGPMIQDHGFQKWRDEQAEKTVLTNDLSEGIGYIQGANATRTRYMPLIAELLKGMETIKMEIAIAPKPDPAWMANHALKVIDSIKTQLGHPQETKMSETIPFKDFIARGEKLFGKDRYKWKFKCPVCGNIQSAQDFKALGADPNSTDFNCIGRYMKKEVNKGLGINKNKVPKQPCDYSSGGFLVVNKVFYIGDDGKKFPTFEFAEPRTKPPDTKGEG